MHESRSPVAGRSPRTAAVLVASIVALAAAAGAQIEESQTPTPVEEPSAFDTLMDRSDLGNVAQAAKGSYHAGIREMKRADKLVEKAAEAPEAKRPKLLKSAQAAYETAAGQFLEAIQLAPDLTEAYAGLGDSLRAQGKPAEALQVHAQALSKWPADEGNFRGWAEALLALDRLGDATRAWTQIAPTQPEQAAVLMSVMKRWLEEKRADPGDLDPADVEKLATWIAANEGTAG